MIAATLGGEKLRLEVLNDSPEVTQQQRLVVPGFIYRQSLGHSCSTGPHTSLHLCFPGLQVLSLRTVSRPAHLPAASV